MGISNTLGHLQNTGCDTAHPGRYSCQILTAALRVSSHGSAPFTDEKNKAQRSQVTCLRVVPPEEGHLNPEGLYSITATPKRGPGLWAAPGAGGWWPGRLPLSREIREEERGEEVCWGWGPGKGSESEVTAPHFLFPAHSTSSPGRAWIVHRPTALLAFAFPLAFVRSPPLPPPHPRRWGRRGRTPGCPSPLLNPPPAHDLTSGPQARGRG